MRRGLVLSLFALVLALTVEGRAEDRGPDNPIAACDAAAASPASDDLPAGVVGVPPWNIDPRIAVPACEAAAKLEPGNARIAYQLGRAYIADKSTSPGLAAYTRADEGGYALATFNLAMMFKGGFGVVVDLPRARSLMEKAARGGAAAAVMKWLEKIAADGDVSAMNALAVYYHDGWVVPADEARAAEWTKKAAAAGNLLASPNELNGAPSPVVLYRARSQVVGINISKDEKAEALRLLEKTAEAGDVDSMAYLAWMYGEARGVSRDYVRSREWSEKAATRGHPMAMIGVGRAYDYGCGVTPNEAEARRWYEKARATMDPRAVRVAEQSLALLDRPDIHRARVSLERARGCLSPATPP